MINRCNRQITYVPHLSFHEVGIREVSNFKDYSEQRVLIQNKTPTLFFHQRFVEVFKLSKPHTPSTLDFRHSLPLTGVYGYWTICEPICPIQSLFLFNPIMYGSNPNQSIQTHWYLVRITIWKFKTVNPRIQLINISYHAIFILFFINIHIFY